MNGKFSQQIPNVRLIKITNFSKISSKQFIDLFKLMQAQTINLHYARLLLNEMHSHPDKVPAQVIYRTFIPELIIYEFIVSLFVRFILDNEGKKLGANKRSAEN